VTANVLKTLSQAVQAQYRNYLSPLFTLKTQVGCVHFMSKDSYEYINSAVLTWTLTFLQREGNNISAFLLFACHGFERKEPS